MSNNEKDSGKLMLEFTAQISMPPEYFAKVDSLVETAEINPNGKGVTVGNDSIGHIHAKDPGFGRAWKAEGTGEHEGYSKKFPLSYKVDDVTKDIAGYLAEESLDPELVRKHVKEHSLADDEISAVRSLDA